MSRFRKDRVRQGEVAENAVFWKLIRDYGLMQH
jgi:hypothetical protein